ncbi:serine/threonine-protein phosphatase 4 regulatory subunit 2 [Diachasma alloeum]|uniref:serine/threonine-protein phosphatase 4 regulatory subunit 2 n=1 Tax=Diachasma alloeum TaxID=454923 RepID=UPI0007382BC6|nr:serine/threonine-protein phosphatase 4 regulatory subunit 2 [Diachasma alloeum]
MENPEEVLQALDEFQKLRPSEIPRELEDYLCFVAKTGDPVYQWSLIKPLFREKLVRVMTDFYESCPTLDLAASPNIEQFNYDSMKGNLLELLESFANAPFTVQRICELLTSPRKEYNRVDKFMRAIEKNILVVSTREPGPAARRSENGDSMINGSMDDESPATHHEVEMESWVKDCTADVPEDETKSPKTSEEAVIQEKQETRTDVNNFITSETSTGTLNSTHHEPTMCSNPQNVPDVSGIVGDVPEAIMNEDTSSQPSLDSESDDSELSNSRKLTFQSRDFGKSEKVEEKGDDKICEGAEKPGDARKAGEESKVNFSAHRQPDLSIDDPIVEKRARLDDESPVIDSVAVSESSETRSASPETKEASEPPGASEGAGEGEKSEEIKETTAAVAEPEAPGEPTPEPEPQAEPEAEREDEVIETDFQELPEYQDKTTDSTEAAVDPSKKEESPSEAEQEAKPIIEEPPQEEPEERAEETGGVVIQEAMDDDAKGGSTLVPDPIPIVEEPKEEIPVDRAEETSIAEIIEAKSPVEEGIAGASETVIPSSVVPTSKESPLDVEELCEQQTPVDEVSIAEGPQEESMEKEPAESMEVDSEDATPVVQQDEPMEEECGEQLKS